MNTTGAGIGPHEGGLCHNNRFKRGRVHDPIGALAGIMWSSILNSHGLKFGYLDFLKIGLVAAVPALLAALAGLSIVL